MSHRLEKRESESFVDRGKHEDLGLAIHLLKLPRVEVVEMMNVARTKARHEFLRLPSDAADHHERSVVPAGSLQILKRVQEDAEVLARLDRADEENVAIWQSGRSTVACGHAHARMNREYAAWIDVVVVQQ